MNANGREVECNRGTLVRSAPASATGRRTGRCSGPSARAARSRPL